MKISDLESNVRTTDIENFFEIYEDNRGNYSYNLNEGLYVNAEGEYQTYILATDAYWPLISYKLYKTTRLAWLLMMINEVDSRHLLDKKRAGDVIKYIPSQTVKSILKQL